MEQTKTNIKNFFLELSSQISLYVVIINLGILLFRIINKIYPLVDPGYYYSQSNISLPVSILIVSFPIFIVLNYILNKEYNMDSLAKESWVRKWLIYITLFVSGFIFSASLVSVLYKFLDGQELTIGFLLKFLTIFILSITTFSYYLADIKNKTNDGIKKISAIVFSICILISIVSGFYILGSPRTQRLLNYDNKKVNDLISIDQQVIYFYQNNLKIPSDIMELSNINGYYFLPKDTQNNKDYVYKIKNKTEYSLCADFNLDIESRGKVFYDNSKFAVYETSYQNNNWNYKKGEYCFERKIPDYIIKSPKIIQER